MIQTLAAPLVAVALAHGLVQDPDATWRASYEVRFDRTAEGIHSADVEATLVWIGSGGAPSHAEVSMSTWDGYPEGYATHVRDLVAVDADASVTEDGGLYRIPVPPGGKTGFRYRVLLEHDPASHPSGPDESPRTFDASAVWTGRALFLTAERSTVELELVVPRGQKATVTYEPGRGRNEFVVYDDRHLRESVLVVGRHREIEVEVGGMLATIVLDSQMRSESRDVLVETVEGALWSARSLFGNDTFPRILVVGGRGERSGWGAIGNHVNLVSDDPLTVEGAPAWRRTVCHELTHLWNGTALRFDGPTEWFREGFTDYYSRILVARLGWMSDADLLEDFAGRVETYVRAAKGLAIEGSDDRALTYVGGSLVALALDVRIRRETGNERSLDDVMAALFTRFGDGLGPKMRWEDLVATLDGVAGVRLGPFLERCVRSGELLPLADAFEDAGLRIGQRKVPLADLKWVVHSLLGCTSVTTGGDGIHVLRDTDGPLRAGDVVVSAGGRALDGTTGIRAAFGGRSPGETVTLEVRREGETRKVELTLGGTADDEPAPEELVVVRIDPIAGADADAVAIRKAIFGK